MEKQADKEADIKADLKTVIDREEAPTLMEPLLIGETSRHRGGLTDLAVELAQKSAGLRRSLPESLLASLADLVRAMNCYYSNLIEGHDTHPVDIERALKDDYSNDARKRDLQLEAKAHITVQQWIDGGGLRGRALTSEGIRETHRRFGSGGNLNPSDDKAPGETRTNRAVELPVPRQCLARKFPPQVIPMHRFAFTPVTVPLPYCLRPQYTSLRQAYRARSHFARREPLSISVGPCYNRHNHKSPRAFCFGYHK